MNFVLPALPRQASIAALLEAALPTVLGRACEAGFALARGWPLPKRANAATHRPAATPLSLADQWSSLVAVLAKSLTSVEKAQNLQAAATQQLDLAQYGISTLLDELSAVMAMPGRGDRRATLHVLESASADEDRADRDFALSAGRRAWAA